MFYTHDDTLDVFDAIERDLRAQRWDTEFEIHSERQRLLNRQVSIAELLRSERS